MSAFRVPMFIRGETIETDWVSFGGRQQDAGFEAPDPHKYADRLPLSSPMALQDLQEIPFEEILDVLAATGEALAFDKNAYIQQAFEAGLSATNYHASMLRQSYLALPHVFSKVNVREMAERRLGAAYLDGWVTEKFADGRELSVRAFGARALHVPAGNGGVVSAISIIRNAITRSDAIIKVPSNDPLTAVAIARTLADVAPDHPLTKHLAVAYWKGGDEAIEQQLYRPEYVEKIVAWGGFASVKHVTKYIQPGLEMIALDPKRSTTIIGPEAFDDDASFDEVAQRAACDIGMANQEACASARVLYVLCGTDPESIEKLNRLGEAIYQKLLELPDHISTVPRTVDRELRNHLSATRLTEDWFRVIGGEQGEGAIIVSQIDEPVDYAPMLSGRVANLVPVDHIDRVTKAVNAYTQTVGVYPESLKDELRDRLPLFGAQRLTSLGYACHPSTAAPQDAIEPIRRMCKWVVDETCRPDEVFPPWQAPRL